MRDSGEKNGFQAKIFTKFETESAASFQFFRLSDRDILDVFIV